MLVLFSVMFLIRLFVPTPPHFCAKIVFLLVGNNVKDKVGHHTMMHEVAQSHSFLKKFVRVASCPAGCVKGAG